MVTTVFSLPGARTEPGLFDGVMDSFELESEAVSLPGRLAHERRHVRGDRQSASQQAYALRQAIHNVVDSVDEELLDTLRVHPETGRHILQLVSVMESFFMEAIALSVRPAENEDDSDPVWMVVVRVSSTPTEALARLREFDAHWQTISAGQGINDVIATVEFA